MMFDSLYKIRFLSTIRVTWNSIPVNDEFRKNHFRIFQNENNKLLQSTTYIDSLVIFCYHFADFCRILGVCFQINICVLFIYLSRHVSVKHLHIDYMACRALESQCYKNIIGSYIYNKYTSTLHSIKYIFIYNSIFLFWCCVYIFILLNRH